MNTAPKTCTESHSSPFLLWGSAAAEPLHWSCTFNPKPKFHQGNCIRARYHCNMPWCVSHQGLGAVWRRGGWLITVAFTLFLSMPSGPCGQLPRAQLHASEFCHWTGNFSCADLWAGACPFCQVNEWCVILLHGVKSLAFTHFHCIHSISGETCPAELWSPADHKHCTEDVPGSGSWLRAHAGTWRGDAELAKAAMECYIYKWPMLKP